MNLREQFEKENNVSAIITERYYFEHYAHWLENKVNQCQWISVKDRLPVMNRQVLVCNINGISQDEREPIAGFYNDDKIWYEPWIDKIIIPTHWMPLPDAPKDESK